MTFLELINSALNKSDEEAGDEMIEDVIKDGINHGYMVIANTIDPITKTTTLNYADPITLPADFLSVVRLEHGGVTLSENDYEVYGSKLKIINSDYKDVSYTFDLTYNYVPNRLTDDTDVPLINPSLHDYLAIYGAYSCLLYKKKYDSAQMLFNEFMAKINEGDVNDVSRNI